MDQQAQAAINAGADPYITTVTIRGGRVAALERTRKIFEPRAQRYDRQAQYESHHMKYLTRIFLALSLAAPVLLSGQSYAGGLDTISLAGVQLQVGEFLIAVWADGVPGDLATMRIQGAESCLVLR